MNGETTGTNLAPDPRTPSSHPPDTVLQGTAVGVLHPSSAAITLSSGRCYEIDATPTGDRLVVRDRDGEVVLRIEVNDTGPKVSFESPPQPQLTPMTTDGARRPSVWDAPGGMALRAWATDGAGSPAFVDGWSQEERATPSLREAIAPPSSKGEHPDELDEPVSVPRATPLPSIRHPSEIEPPYLEARPSAARDSAWPGLRALRDPGGVRDSAFISDAPQRARAGTSAPPKPLRPSAADAPPTRRAVPSLSLEQYAALCAEAAAGTGAAFAQALVRYGIAGEEAWRLLDRGWQERLAREPILTLRWMDLSARYREHLTRR